jgi:hypothetical protein
MFKLLLITLFRLIRKSTEWLLSVKFTLVALLAIDASVPAFAVVLVVKFAADAAK